MNEAIVRARRDKWDGRFMQIALQVASWSKDRSRQVGCVIADAEQRILATGYNGFPRGVDDYVELRHQRPAKYKWTEHAERNAIYQAANLGISLRDTTIYLPWYPCADCARAIVQSGIRFVVAVEPDWNDPTFAEDFKITREILDEGGVYERFIEGMQPPTQQTIRPATDVVDVTDTDTDVTSDNIGNVSVR